LDVAPDLAREEALARFTVRDADGSLVSGGIAFPLIWKQLPRFRWLAKLSDIQPFAWSLGAFNYPHFQRRPLHPVRCRPAAIGRAT